MKPLSALKTLMRVCAVLCVFLMSNPVSLLGQTTAEVVIFPGASIYAHPNSFTNVFSDVTNQGKFTTAGQSLVNFYGSTWRNTNGSTMPDESSDGLSGMGGVFRFSGQFQNTQRIVTVGFQPYNGFPNLRIDNVQNVTLETGSAYVNNVLDFVNGKLILSNVDLNVGRAGGGDIMGYDRDRYVVTGTGFTGGSLVRNLTGASGSPTTYPVGTSLTSYTPANILYKGIPQNLKVRVADNVYGKLNFSEYVYKTWIVQRELADAKATIDITLQHNAADEGVEYFRNRPEAYLSRYTPGLTGLYDITAPVPSTTPGSISDRTPVFNAYMNTRLNVGALKPIEYFTKSVIKKLVDESTPVNVPDAISPNGDGFNDTYVVEKRLPTDKVRFEVFTRNQVPVYQNLDYDNSFNGTGNLGGFMGSVLPDGIYIYLISVNGAKGIPGYLIINR